MKRFLALVLSFVLFAVPLAPFVQAADENTQTEYFEDGSYMVIGSDEFVDREDAEDSLNFIGRIIEAIKKLILFPEKHAKVMSIFYNMIDNIVSEECPCKSIAPAVRYIQKNYKNTNLSNTVLAKECNMSEIYLRKLFNKHLKTTPKQYISEIRLQKAKQLLSEGNLKINSISEECGFQSSYNFCRFFKVKTGLTPTDYMKQNKSSKI